MAPPLIAVLNGPNLNLLGTGAPGGVPGGAPGGMSGGMSGMAGPTLDDAEQLCAEAGEALGLAIDFRQTNGEGELVSWVQECRGTAARAGASGIVLAPGAYARSSPALGEAVRLVGLPVIEVYPEAAHRAGRWRSHVSAGAAGVVCGFGIRGYALALTGLAGLLNEMEEAGR